MKSTLPTVVNGKVYLGTSGQVNVYGLLPTTPVPPPLPTGLAAVATSATQINLSWTASSGATSYTVYRKDARSTVFTPIGAAVGTTFSDTSVTAGTDYSYEVSATNAYGSSGNSAPRAITAPGLPAPPTFTGVSAVAPDQINLGWNGTINASSYDLYRSISSDGPFIHFGPIYGPAYSDTGLAADTTYYYQVTVTNAFGTSARSATASATTHVAAP